VLVSEAPESNVLIRGIARPGNEEEVPGIDGVHIPSRPVLTPSIEGVGRWAGAGGGRIAVRDNIQQPRPRAKARSERKA
jgi:hypothetical protein